MAWRDLILLNATQTNLGVVTRLNGVAFLLIGSDAVHNHLVPAKMRARTLYCRRVNLDFVWHEHQRLSFGHCARLQLAGDDGAHILKIDAVTE